MKKALIAGLAIGLCLASSAQAAPIWIQYSGHEYALTETWTTWGGAQAIAATYSATLVTIEDAAENGWLSATFDGLAYGRDGSPDPWMSAAWIGLYLDSGGWYWDNTRGLAGYMPPGSFSTGGYWNTRIHAHRTASLAWIMEQRRST